MGSLLRTQRPRIASIASVLKRHAHMVLDPLRTQPLKHAIDRVVKPGDVVLDIGTGIGLLAFFACHAGAKHVYAIDVDAESLRVAGWYTQELGLSDRITFIEGLSFSLELERKVDVIICETIGQVGFEENILATLRDAKQRLLKRNGRIIPERIELWGALASATSLLSKPQQLVVIDTQKKFDDCIHLTPHFCSTREGKLTGITCWPRVTWAKGFVTDAAPTKPRTHWGQAHLDISPQRVHRGEEFAFELIVQPDSRCKRTDTEILWRLT